MLSQVLGNQDSPATASAQRPGVRPVKEIKASGQVRRKDQPAGGQRGPRRGTHPTLGVPAQRHRTAPRPTRPSGKIGVDHIGASHPDTRRARTSVRAPPSSHAQAPTDSVRTFPERRKRPRASHPKRLRSSAPALRGGNAGPAPAQFDPGGNGRRQRRTTEPTGGGASGRGWRRGGGPGLGRGVGRAQVQVR